MFITEPQLISPELPRQQMTQVSQQNCTLLEYVKLKFKQSAIKHLALAFSSPLHHNSILQILTCTVIYCYVNYYCMFTLNRFILCKLQYTV